MKQKQKRISCIVTIICMIVIAISFNYDIVSVQAATQAKMNQSSAKIAVGKTTKLKITNLPKGQSVTWTSSNKKAVTVKGGVVTAKAVGTATITASYGSTKLTCKVTVYQPAKTVKLKSSSSYIEVGDTFQINPVFTPANATYQNMTWSIKSRYGDACVKRVKGNTFKAVDYGSVTISGYQKDTKKTYTIELYINSAMGPFHIEEGGQKVTSITTYVGGGTIVTGAMDNENIWSEELQFTYKVDDPKIASVDKKGQIKGLKNGTTTLRVTAENQKTMTCKVVVTDLGTETMLSRGYMTNMDFFMQRANYTDWVNYSGPDTTFLFPQEDGELKLVVSQIVNNQSNLLIYTYKENGSLEGKRSIMLPYPVFGSVYQSKSGDYYVALGQENEEENDDKVVYSILRFDRNWNKTGQVDFTGRETSTTIPFDAGNCQMTEADSILVMHTSRERYTSDDGKNHQSNITMMVDMNSMTKSYVGALFPYNHVSHSFNQFVQFDGNNLIYVDHGDAYPRSIVMQTHYGFSLNGWSDQYQNRPIVNSMDCLKILGDIGQNYTGTKVNGFETGNSNNIIAGVSVPHTSMSTSELKTLEVQNVYVILADKSGYTSNLVWLTDYSKNGDLTASNLRMVKVNEDRFALLYQIENIKTRDYNIGYLLINSNGEVIDSKQFAGYLSCIMKPVVIQNRIVWIDAIQDIEWLNPDSDFESDAEKKEYLSTFNIKMELVMGEG